MSAVVYRHYDSTGNLLYVGSSMSVFARTMQHMYGSEWAKRVAKITIEHYAEAPDAAAAEVTAIGKESPQYNKKHMRPAGFIGEPMDAQAPNWTQLINDIQARGLTLDEIAEQCGFASKGAVHDLKTSSRQKTCVYERGVLLVALHRKMLRRKITRPKFLAQPSKGAKQP